MVAPAGPVDPARLDTGLAILGERYQPICDRDALLTRSGYLAGDDARRADELNRALRDADVRAIFLARGGYGLTRILADLDVEALRADPKPIVGFSDGTALLSWALTQAGVRGIHGPVVGQLGSIPASDHRLLFELLERPQAPGLVATELETVGIAPGDVDGMLVPGNLCLLSHLVGTPYSPMVPGAVPVIEDVGERPYAIDRYLTHLAAAGCFDGVEVAIVGDFAGCVENKILDSPEVVDVIAERLSSFGIAGLRLRGVGHGSSNRALPFGARVTIAAGQLSIMDPAVAERPRPPATAR